MEEELKKCKILIIDDKLTNVELLLELLDNHGFQNISQETDSRNALQIIESYKPDLILLDLMMPFVSGFEILEALQKKALFENNCKILVLTADVTLPTKQKALALGAHDFLTKPFDLLETVLRIKNLLLSSYLFKQVQQQNQHLEEKVAERTLELMKSNASIKEQVKALKDIAWMQSHVVRAPVARILGLMEVIKDPEADESLKKMLSIN